MDTVLTVGGEKPDKKVQESLGSSQQPENGRSGEKSGGMPEGVERSGQLEEGSPKQEDRLARDSLDDSVVVKDLDTGRAINVLKVRSHGTKKADWRRTAAPSAIAEHYAHSTPRV